MIAGYLTAGQAAQWKAVIKPRLFATSKQLGRTESVLFWRDADQNGVPEQIGPYEVLIVAADRQPVEQIGPASSLLASDGEFRSSDPMFDVRVDDRFTLSKGETGRITGQTIWLESYWRVPFELE